MNYQIMIDLQREIPTSSGTYFADVLTYIAEDTEDVIGGVQGSTLIRFPYFFFDGEELDYDEFLELFLDDEYFCQADLRQKLFTIKRISTEYMTAHTSAIRHNNVLRGTIDFEFVKVILPNVAKGQNVSLDIQQDIEGKYKVLVSDDPIEIMNETTDIILNEKTRGIYTCVIANDKEFIICNIEPKFMYAVDPWGKGEF